MVNHLSWQMQVDKNSWVVRQRLWSEVEEAWNSWWDKILGSTSDPVLVRDTQKVESSSNACAETHNLHVIYTCWSAIHFLKKKKCTKLRSIGFFPSHLLGIEDRTIGQASELNNYLAGPAHNSRAWNPALILILARATNTVLTFYNHVYMGLGTVYSEVGHPSLWLQLPLKLNAGYANSS